MATSHLCQNCDGNSVVWDLFEFRWQIGLHGSSAKSHEFLKQQRITIVYYTAFKFFETLQAIDGNDHIKHAQLQVHTINSKIDDLMNKRYRH